MVILEKNFKYIDLFAGIGGFHYAMKKYSSKSECIMASEINPEAANTYANNFKMKVDGDIKLIEPKQLGIYDVVCGGFPCQPFSKGGSQKGFKDPRGTLFQEIVRIISYQPKLEDRPKILILENVRNLISHDNGDTWRTIRKYLQDAGYNIIEKPIVMGPKDVGIPQLRDRAIILGVRKDIYDGEIKLKLPRKKPNSTSIYTIIDTGLTKEEMKKYKISEHTEKVLDAWNSFYKGIDEKVIGFPIWSDEFGKDYNLSIYPEWKQQFVRKNRELYERNKKFIDRWFENTKIRDWATATERKFEWNCGTDIKDVYEGLIQIRPSGVRIKRPTEAPTLVAMNHRIIIGREKRYMTLREAARLQSFPDTYNFKGENEATAFKQLGNAVNVNVINYVFKTFVKYLEDEINAK